MQRAADGRHLLAYADDPDIQDLWERRRRRGRPAPGGLMVTVQNIAADKLDWYIDPTVDAASRHRDRHRRLEGAASA